MKLDEAMRAVRSRRALERARAARWLAGGAARAELAAIADEAVVELARQPGRTWASVAETLGVSASAVGKAIYRHNLRVKAAS